MAAKKKILLASGNIVAFALCDHVAGDEGQEKSIVKGQRLDLDQSEFDVLAENKICVEGVLVSMNVAVEGKRYSLKPNENAWLAPDVFEAWKALGFCVAASGSQQSDAAFAATEEASRVAISENAALSGKLQEAELLLLAARAQAEKLRALVEPKTDSGDVLDDDAVALLAEIVTLLGMFPDELNAE